MIDSRLYVKDQYYYFSRNSKICQEELFLRGTQKCHDPIPTNDRHNLCRLLQQKLCDGQKVGNQMFNQAPLYVL